MDGRRRPAVLYQPEGHWEEGEVPEGEGDVPDGEGEVPEGGGGVTVDKNTTPPPKKVSMQIEEVSTSCQYDLTLIGHFYL